MLEAGNLEAEATDCLDAILFTTGTFGVWMMEAADRGVPSIVDSGALNVLIESRRFGGLGSSSPLLDPGRLTALLEGLPEASDL